MDQDGNKNDCGCDTIIGCIKKECPARRYLIAQCPMIKEVSDVSKHVCPEKECEIYQWKAKE